LNDEFDAEHDTSTYEAKVSKLLDRAYARLKKENPETDSIRILRKGDHYILALWGILRPPCVTAKLVTASLAAALLFGIKLTAGNCNFRWPTGLESHRTPPVGSVRLLTFLMIGGYVYYVVLPWISKKPPESLSKLSLKLFPGSRDKTSDEHAKKFNRKS
jgi:hypothetical protein